MVVQNAIALDKLMYNTEEAEHRSSVRLSDGKDLVNLVMGMQDVDFREK